MNTSEFYRPFSIDTAPHGRRCEWCEKPALHQITALGGLHHNQGGFFCQDCGLEFIRIIMEATPCAKEPLPAFVPTEHFILCDV